MTKIVTWYSQGSRLLAQLARVRPREQLAELNAFSRETKIAVSYARRILAATKAVDEIAVTDGELAADLKNANVQAAAIIWRWLAYDKKAALTAAVELTRNGMTVRALEEKEKFARNLVKSGLSGSAKRKAIEDNPIRRRMALAEAALGEASKIIGSGRLDWVRPGLIPGHQNRQHLPLKLSWLNGVRFGHFIFDEQDGTYVLCRVIWPRELAARANIRSVVLTALGIADFNIRVLLITTEESIAAEATAMLAERKSTRDADVRIVILKHH